MNEDNKNNKKQEKPKESEVNADTVVTNICDHLLIKDETTGKILVNKRG